MIKEAVAFILNEMAANTCEAWDQIAQLDTDTRLTTQGFEMSFPEAEKFGVSMYEYRGTLFVGMKQPRENHGQMAFNQKEARRIYNNVVDLLFSQ